MTDQEIIKALDWCKEFENNIIINGEGDKKCAQALKMTVIIRSALGNYIRQQAEIEELQRNLKFVRGTVERQLAEIERLEGDLIVERTRRENAVGAYHEAKAEAVREFAKKTDEMITEIYNNHIFGNNDLEAEEKDAIINFSADVASGFDNIVEEMAGTRHNTEPPKKRRKRGRILRRNFRHIRRSTFAMD